jgi:hypothetical protein
VVNDDPEERMIVIAWTERLHNLVRDLVVEVGSPEPAATVSLDSAFGRDLGLTSLEVVEPGARREEVGRSSRLQPAGCRRNVAGFPTSGGRGFRRWYCSVKPMQAMQGPGSTRKGRVPHHSVTLVETLDCHVATTPGRLLVCVLAHDDVDERSQL